MLEKILKAIKAGDLDEIKRLKEAGADLTAADKDGRTPAHYAAMSTTDVVEAVKKAGADFTAADIKGYTPVDDAVVSNLPEVVAAVREAEEACRKEKEEKESMSNAERYTNEAFEREKARDDIRKETEDSLQEHDPAPDLGKGKDDPDKPNL